jgi:cell division protein FtsZ
MFDTGVRGAEFWAMNTDVQALGAFADSGIKTLHIGQEVTKGLGSGSIPENGRRSAEVSRDDIHKAVDGADLVFITAGMGGGTGSGAAPVVAEIARKAGALTVGVVTKPFAFEGTRRMEQANNAIKALKNEVDTLITISNERLLKIVPDDTPMQKAFAVADDVLRQAVVGISEIIIRPGLINVDFADVKAIMGHAGTALMGIGKGSGKMRAKEAAVAAISSPLLDFPIMKAKGVMFNIVGGRDLSLQEVDAAAEIIYEAVDTNANIKFGAMIDDSIKSGEITITVIATGFPEDSYFSTDSRRLASSPASSRAVEPKASRGKFTSLLGRLFGFGRNSASGSTQRRDAESVDSVMNRVAGAGHGRQRGSLADAVPSTVSSSSSSSSFPLSSIGASAGSRSAADSADVPDFLRALKRSR